MSTVSVDERSARVAFARLTEPGHAAAAQELAEYGYIRAYERLVQHSSPLWERVAPRWADLDLELEERALGHFQARLLIPGDPEWPRGLDDLSYPPHCLWVRGTGNLAELCARSAAIVGARAATDYGSHVAAELGYGLIAYGMSVISGAAFGIDAAAHRGALAAGGATVAALACGVDRAYPAAHESLLAQIVSDGCLVSEVAPGGAPLRSRFLERNRMIAALSRGTVVVEAGLRSGSLNTAGWAEKCLRPVGAVPGPVTSATSAGTNEWIRSRRAELVTDAAEVVELVGELGADVAPTKTTPTRDGDGLAPEQHQVWQVLPTGRAASVDRLSAACGQSWEQTAAALGALALAGVAAQDAQGWRRA